MALRAFIAQNELQLPENFSLPSELHSPIYDFKEFRIGDYEMGISFPANPQNRIAFGFADELHQANKKIRYDDFRLEQDGRLVLAGILELTNSKSAIGSGYFECDFFTNLFGIDMVNQPLSAIMSKVVDLGSTSASIAISAHAQTVAAMSTNGTTGSVMKFIPTYAPDFYGDTNPDWQVSASQYRFESEYEVNDHVTFRLPEFIQDYPGIPADIPYAIIPKLFRATAAVLDGETPFARSDKWTLVTRGVFNSMLEGDFNINQFYNEATNSINRNGLLPSLQAHDVFREIAKALGYSIEGQFMDDPIEQRALLFSNLALDKSSGSPNYIYVGKSTVQHLGPGVSFGSATDYDLQDEIYQNENDLYNDDPGPAPVAAYKCEATGPYKVRIMSRIQNNRTEARQVETILAKNASVTVSSISKVQAASTTENMELLVFIELTAGDEFFPSFANADDSDFDILQTTFEVQNIETDFLNVYEGSVNYADHVPDGSVADFIYAWQLWKNLFQGFDPVNRIWRLDYTDQIIKQNTNMIELKPYQIPGQNIETKPRKRFELNYANVDNIYEKPANITELDPIAAVQDLPPPKQANVCILIKNINSYYVTKEYDYGGRLFWDFAGYAWYDLKIEAEGDLFPIKPDLGPVAMGRFQGSTPNETIGPVYTDQGRSAMYLPGGKRPGIQVMYWLGMDTTIEDEGVPYATTTRADYNGTNIFSRGMAWIEQYPVTWKRTLQMLVLEELITARFHLPPEIMQVLSFSKLSLFGYVPVIPIRSSQLIGAPTQQIEVEGRKVKMEPLTIVSDDNEEVESEMLSPFDIGNIGFYFDGKDPEQMTLETDNYISQWNDKSLNSNHALQPSASRQPQYNEAGFVYTNIDYMNLTTLFEPSSTQELILVIQPTAYSSSVAERVLGYYGGGSIIDLAGLRHSATPGSNIIETASNGSGYAFSENTQWSLNEKLYLRFSSNGNIYKNLTPLDMYSSDEFVGLTKIQQVAGWNYSAPNSFIGNIFAMILYDGIEMTDEQWTKQYAWLTDRHG